MNFTQPITFYNNPEVFALQSPISDNKSLITEDDEFFNSLFKETLNKAIEAYNAGDIAEIYQETIIRSLIIATINGYRAIHDLSPMVVSGTVSHLAIWQATQYAEHTGHSLLNTLSKRKYQSANLSAIDHPYTTNLFLGQALGFNDIVQHVDSHQIDLSNKPDKIVTKNIWTAAEIKDASNWPQYAADIVSHLSSSDSGKTFLTQSSTYTLYIGLDLNTFSDGSTSIDVLSASMAPTTL